MTLDQWIASTEALLELDAKGALVPHGIGGHARTLLQEALDRENSAAAKVRAIREGGDGGGFCYWPECSCAPEGPCINATQEGK